MSQNDHSYFSIYAPPANTNGPIRLAWIGPFQNQEVAYAARRSHALNEPTFSLFSR